MVNPIFLSCEITLYRSVDVIENTFNLMLLALLVYFAILFCLQGFLIISVSTSLKLNETRFIFIYIYIYTNINICVNIFRSLVIVVAMFPSREYVGSSRCSLTHSFTCVSTVWSVKHSLLK